MSFKLLAIRPLKGCDPNLLKGLKINCVYRFYNEYEFINCIDKNVNDAKYIIDQVGYEDQVVSKIKYIKQVPKNLYAENINISAIVGQNGSGKSSLLELLYAFSHNISQKFLQKSNLIEDKLVITPDKVYCKLNVEIYIESIGDDQLNKTYKISCKRRDNNCQIEISELNADLLFEKVENPSEELLFSFYSIVLNYSLYGLNSNITGGWLDALFHKNDNYQYPIVLNPFRKNGNIDVNKELYLAQARLILNYFVIGNKDIVDNISFKNVQLYLDIDKHQYLEYNLEDEDSPTRKSPTINSFFNFLNRIFFPSSESLAMFFELVRSTFKLQSNAFNRILNEEFSPLKIALETHETKIFADFINDDNYLGFEYISFLYIYKKLKKISETYDTYKQYAFLFNDEIDTLSLFGVNTLSLEDQFKDQFNNENLKIYSVPGEHRENLLNDLYNHYEKRFNIYLSKVNTLEENKNRKYIEELLDSFFKQKYKNTNLKDLINYVFTDLDNQLKDFRYNILKNYFIELANDNSHITFKLKQVLNYFSTDLFSKIEFSEKKMDYRYNRYDVINSKVLLDPNKIETKGLSIESVPLAVLQHEITLKKDKKTIPFSGLSSGEQQLIHTFLGISYHIYNLKSNYPKEEQSSEEKLNKLYYKNVNIIFDEVELYLHPEYQRVFIKKLIDSLSFFKEDLINFNILISTHSPFILSDIPTQNVLKLKKGKPVKDKDQINSFGANIHDLLADDFFLENGVIGEYASNRINDIYKSISKTDITKVNYMEYQQEINLIGEVVLKKPLFELLDKKLQESISDKIKLVNYYQEIIDKLNS